VLALVSFAAFAVGAQAKAPRTFYGIVPQTHVERSEFKLMGDGGTGTVRAMLSWASVDPSADADDYNWHTFDAIVGDAARNRITVLPFLFGTPNWVARGLDGNRCGGDCVIYAPRGAAALTAWREFVAAAVERYGRGGEFWAENPDLPTHPITAWQIWNEQNSKSFYRPRPTAKGYAKLLDTAAAAINARDARADIVLGGMAELAGSRKATAGSKYLRKLYRRKGAKKDFDGVAAHPYGAKLNNLRQQVDGYRAEMKRARDGRASLWITEIGWGSAAGGNPLNVGKKGQAKRLQQTFRYFVRARNKLNLKLVAWFSWRDSATSICDWCASSGLYTKGLRPKPAWRAFTKLTPR
jgi:hypothetical protein